MSSVEKFNASELLFMEEEQNWYAVMEGAHPHFNIRELIYRHVANPEWVAIYQCEPYEGIASVSPVLVKLDQPRDWLDFWLAEFPALSGSLLRSEHSIETVVAHLRTLVSVRVEGGVESIFRFHDSWISSVLYPALDDAERAMFNGPVRQWLWIVGQEAFLTEAEGIDVMHRDALAQSEGWLELCDNRQNIINKSLMSKRNWKETYW
ncbi:DUF4123 domain-containing protein [Marinobacter shengliensis]|uniref:DUF4123 domain-containing protein n=1 Tax=Marinobacter shengliensis TaxID=1389223 RepID=UPI0035BB111A